MLNDPVIDLRLPSNFVGQILDGLEKLAEDWEFTSRCGTTGFCTTEGDLHMRDCNGPHEATRIAEFYREIIDSIRAQYPPRNPGMEGAIEPSTAPLRKRRRRKSG